MKCRLPSPSPLRFLVALLVFGGCFGARNQAGAQVEIPDLDQARQKYIQKIDSRRSLETLIQVLGSNLDPRVQKSLLKGILLGLEGQRNVDPPPKWNEVRVALSESSDKGVKDLTQELSQVFGDKAASQKALATLQDSGVDKEDRGRALSSLLAARDPGLLPLLPDLFDFEPLRIAAIRGYSVYESADAPGILLKRYPNWNAEAQRAAIETLATRKSYAEALFKALETNEIAREEIPTYTARSLSSLLGEKFAKKFGVQKLPEDKEALIADYKKKANSEALAKADPSRGRLVYQRVCMACHKMYDEGGIIGPELTGSNRGDLNYLLLNILDPSGDIPDAYKMVIITTKDGQVLTGTVTAEDDQKVTVSMVGQETTVAKGDIAGRETSPVSMMPEGLLQTLKDQEILDLIKYFQSKQQVDLPK